MATIRIDATDSTASEGSPANDGEFTITLSEASDKDTAVTLSIAGTATAGADYVALPTSVVIIAGDTTAVLDVSVINDLPASDLKQLADRLNQIAHRFVV